MADLYKFLEKLKNAHSAEDFIQIEQWYLAAPQKLAYSREMVDAVRSKDPRLGLALLMRLYTCDVRDPNAATNYEHLIQTLIRLEWADGLQYLLVQDPSLVNIGVMVGIPNRQLNKIEWSVKPLLSEMKDKCTNSAIIKLVLDAKPDLALIDSNFGMNIVHEFAFRDRKKNSLILEYVLEHAPMDVLNAEDFKGCTPCIIAAVGLNKDFLPFFKDRITKKFGQNVTDSIIVSAEKMIDSSKMPTDIFSANSESKSRYLNTNFKGALPSPSPAGLISAVIGKQIKRKEKQGKEINTLVFANAESLCEYVVNRAEKDQNDFITNAFVMVKDGIHAVNVFCIKLGTTVKTIVIDGGGDKLGYSATLKDEITENLKRSKLECQTLRMKTTIHTQSSGCQLITNYLSSKLSRLSLIEAQAFFEDLKNKADESGGLDVGDFPLWLGIMAITQSMTLIKEGQLKKTPKELQMPYEYKSETFDEMLRRGCGPMYCPGYRAISNKEVNKTLERKARNQALHAQKVTNLSADEMMEEMAKVLGLDITSKDWKKDLLLIQNELAEWRKLTNIKPK